MQAEVSRQPRLTALRVRKWDNCFNSIRKSLDGIVTHVAISVPVPVEFSLS